MATKRKFNASHSMAGGAEGPKEDGDQEEFYIDVRFDGKLRNWATGHTCSS